MRLLLVGRAVVDNEETIGLNSQPAVRAVDALMGAFQRLNSEVVRTNSLISDQLKKTESLRGVGLSSRSVTDPQVTALLSALRETSRRSSVISQALSTPSIDATIRNAENLRQQREDAYLRTREARVEILRQKIALANGAERENLRIKRQRLVVDGEELRMARGETNEYSRQKQILDRMLDTQRQQTIEQRRQLQLSNMQTVARNREEIQARAGVGLAIARDRVTGSGAADTFGIQTALTANFFIVTELMQAMRFATDFVVQFDKALFNLQAITSATDGTMANFRRTIEDVANSTKFTAVEVAQAAQVLGQAGFTAVEVQQALGAVAQYASATGIEISEAVDLMTSAISVFSMTAREATDVANTFTAAINNSKLTQQQLALAFSYVANTANQSGISFKELTATIAGLANAGIRSGSTIGTNLRALIIDLQSPSEKLREQLQTLGLSMYDIDLAANGLIGVIQNLRASGFSAAEAFETLETRSAAAFLALSGQADTLDAIQQALSGTNAAAEASDTQMQSLANTLANFQSVIGTLALNTFEPVVRALQDLFEATNSIIMSLNQLSAESPAVEAAINGIGIAIAVLGTVALANVVMRITGMKAAMIEAGGTAGVLGKATDALRAKLTSTTTSFAQNTAAVRQWGLNMGVASQATTQLAAGPLSVLARTLPILPAQLAATAGGARAVAFGMTAVQVGIRGVSLAFTALGGPMGLFIAAITFLPMLLNRSAEQTRNLAEAVDQARTALDSARAAFDENTNVISGLSEEIEQLRNQEIRLRNSENDLEGGQQALRTRAAELVETYGEMGIELNSLTATYDDMVAAVYRLRDAYVEQGIAAAQALESSAVSNASALRDQVTGINLNERRFSGGQVQIPEAEAAVIAAGQGTTRAYSLTEDRVTSFNGGLEANRRFRDAFESFQQVIASGDTEAIQREGAQVRDVELNAAIQELNEVLDENPNNRDIQDLRESLIGLRGTIARLLSAERLVSLTGRETRIQERRQSEDVRSEYIRANELRDAYQAAFDALRQNTTADPRERERLFRETVAPIAEQMQDRYAELFSAGGDRQFQEALRREGIDSLLNFDPAEANTYLAALKTESIETSEAIVRILLRAANTGIQAELESLQRQRNPEELAETAARIDNALDSWAQTRLRQFYLSLGFTDQDIAAGIDTSSFTWSQRDGLNAVNAEIAEKRQESDDQVQNRRQRIETDMRNERIGAIAREIRNLEASLRSALNNMVPGSGRSTLDRVLVQQMAMIDAIQEREAERIRLEAQERNIDPETLRLRLEDLEADFNRRRLETQQDYEQRFRQGSARTMPEAYGDLREDINERYLSEAAKEATSFASTFRDTILSALDATNKGFQKFFYDISTGTKSVGEGFRDLAVTILDSMLQVVTSKIAEQFLSLVLDLAFAAFGSAAPKGVGKTKIGFTPKWEGGFIQAFGGRGITTRDTVPVLAADGEFILRQSAVKAIGQDKLEEMNALGNRTISKSSKEMKPFEINMPPPSTTNVWVVSEDQMPPLGPNDVIATIVNDGRRGGAVKQLIKQVVAGAS